MVPGRRLFFPFFMMSIVVATQFLDLSVKVIQLFSVLELIRGCYQRSSKCRVNSEYTEGFFCFSFKYCKTKFMQFPNVTITWHKSLNYFTSLRAAFSESISSLPGTPEWYSEVPQITSKAQPCLIAHRKVALHRAGRCRPGNALSLGEQLWSTSF